MTSNALPARLHRVLREMRWTQGDLAAATGASKQTVSRWMRDGHISIDPQFAFALQDETGFCARWILLGDGPVHASETDVASLAPELRAEHLRHMQTIARIFREAKHS